MFFQTVFLLSLLFLTVKPVGFVHWKCMSIFSCICIARTLCFWIYLTVVYLYICTWEYSSTCRALLSGFSSLVVCLYTHIHVYRNTPIYLGHCFLSSSVQADFVSSCLPVNKKVVQQVLSTSLLFFFLNALAQGFYFILPWHVPLL